VNRYRVRRIRRAYPGTPEVELLEAHPHLLISPSTKHIVFFSGLRGAVSFSCANIFPDTNGNK
jgi:NhaP-type Na+/H+ or K+/H+ antiporter